MNDLSYDSSQAWLYYSVYIKSIVILNNITSIGNFAFEKCFNLKSITIPESVTSIGDYAFFCSNLTSVTIPSNVSCIGKAAFDGCNNLTSVTIPEGVISIGDYAFFGCGFTSLTIPEGMTSIGYEAFASCKNLTSVTIPGSVTSIGDDAFLNCSGLMNVYVNPANQLFCDQNGVLFNKNMETIVFFPNGRTGMYEIPEGVINIGEHAFADCGLTTVTIPSSVTCIGKAAFNCCLGLTNVMIPSNVTTIGQSAFHGCSSLTSVTIPEGVIRIEPYTFGGCSGLASVTISESVTSIGVCAFQSCSSLTNVTIPEGVTSIESSTFSGCSGLTSVTIPEGVTIVGRGAFNGCNNLTDVYYAGTKAQWDIISIALDNTPLVNATRHYMSTYTVEYDANGGTNTPNSQTKIHDTVLTLTTSTPTRANASSGSYTVTLNANGGNVSTASLSAARTTSYSFKNWNTAANGSGTSYAPGASYIANADVTLYAQWNSNTTTNAVTLPTPTRSGYTFKGWGTSSTDSSGVTGSYTPSGNITLYAIWRQNNHTVTYNANGGTNAPNAQSKIPGTALIITSDVPTHAFWFFLGWAESADATTAAYQPGDSFTKDADTTLYAVWLKPDFVLPDALTEIGEEAFANCGFTYVKLPENTDTIGKNAFANCPNLKYIYIPKDCLWIDRYAFTGVTGLTILGVPGSYAQTYASGKGFTFIPAS